MRVIPIEFSVGYIDADEEEGVLESMRKLDPHVYVHNPRPPQLMINIETGKRLRCIRFCMLVEYGQEKTLFFKLKLKYPKFKRLF
jgi:hypothetical protein